MKLERLLPLLVLPCAAHAGSGGGAIVGVIIFLPLLIWAFIKIWSFWFHLIFGRRKNHNPDQEPSEPQQSAVIQASPAMKVCPFCAELVQGKAIKCKHCRSDLQ